uniref:Uncharacterized protein n=1 Tax=Acrobeloides nanus TaxID=290746 RepID=A0A914CS35_9BILA
TTPLVGLSNVPTNIDVYNWYQDCYLVNYLTGAQNLVRKVLNIASDNRMTQTADLLNYDSTDNQNGYTCYNDAALANYFNKSHADVMKAFHIDQAWIDSKAFWQDCNNDLYFSYIVKYNDTTPVFFDIISTLQTISAQQNPPIKNFRILIYNGDVDTVCNFLGDAVLMDQIANQKSFDAGERIRWWFRNQIAGYHQPYSLKLQSDNVLNLDVLTVKGSGHFVPNDRPGPSMKMITNFLWNTGNYSNIKGTGSYSNLNIDERPQPNDLTPATTGPTGNAGSTTGTIPKMITLVIVVFYFAVFKH